MSPWLMRRGAGWRAVHGLLQWALAAGLAQSAVHAATTAPDLPVRPWSVASVDPAQTDDSDLKAFADAIGEARVVALDEQTHGGREEFLLKLRLLKYLHEKMGFEVLLLESGFYDVGQLTALQDQGQKIDDMAPGNIFFMYAKSEEGRSILRYLDQQKAAGTPLLLAGIDSQHTGQMSTTSLLSGLTQFLQGRGFPLAQGPDWQTYMALAQPLFSQKRDAPVADQQAVFYRVSDALQKALCTDTDNSRFGPQWWCQAVRSVQSQATTYWSGGKDYQRDNQMGANTIWLADKLFGGKKAVVWAHTVHVARGFQRSPGNLQAGEVMHRHWGSAYKVVHFTAARGTVLDFADMATQTLAPPPANSLEASLSRAGYTIAGMAAPRKPLDMPQFNYGYVTHPPEVGVPGQLGVNWDLLFFVDTMHPVRMNR